MPSKAVQKCEKILLHLAEQGFTYQVTKKELHRAITLHIGADPRTLRNWTETLKLLGYIKEVSPLVYQINYVKVPSALTKLMKGNKQKKLM